MQFNEDLTPAELLNETKEFVYHWLSFSLFYQENKVVSPKRIWKQYNAKLFPKRSISSKSFYDVLKRYISDLNKNGSNIIIVRKAEGLILQNCIFRPK